MKPCDIHDPGDPLCGELGSHGPEFVIDPQRYPGGPVRSGRRVLWTPQFEVTFDQDLTDEEIRKFVARFEAACQPYGREVFEPIPDFAECGRPGCDLREKRMEHGHFGDRQPRIRFVDRRSFARRFADSLVELFDAGIFLPTWFVVLAVGSVIVAALIGWARL